MLKRSDYDKCIGYWVELRDDDDDNDALQYLKLWKKFYLRQLPEYQFVDEEYISNKKIFDGEKYIDTLGLKIFLKKVDNDESDA